MTAPWCSARCPGPATRSARSRWSGSGASPTRTCRPPARAATSPAWRSRCCAARAIHSSSRPSGGLSWRPRAVRLVARDLDPGEDAVLGRCGLAPVELEALEPPPGPLYVAVECGLLDAPAGPPREAVEVALRRLAADHLVVVVALTGTSPARVSPARRGRAGRRGARRLIAGEQRSALAIRCGARTGPAPRPRARARRSSSAGSRRSPRRRWRGRSRSPCSRRTAS